MTLQFTPLEGVRAKPLEIEDPFGAGWTFLTVRTDALSYQPFRAQLGRARIAAEALPHFQKLVQLQEVMADDDDSASDEERAERYGEKAALLLDDEACEALDRQATRLEELRSHSPRTPEAVGPLVVGWRGMREDDGTEIPFTRDALLSLLADDGPMAVMNGDGKPLVLTSGVYGGYTVGRALCHFLPVAIETQAGAEDVEIEAKKAGSESPPGSGRGSATKKKPKRLPRAAQKTSGE
jgi:hypothetical protein